MIGRAQKLYLKFEPPCFFFSLFHPHNLYLCRATGVASSGERFTHHHLKLKPTQDSFLVQALRSHARRLFRSLSSRRTNQDMPMDKYREDKINQCEEFLERRLKPALIRAIADRDKVFEQQQIFSDLKRNIQNLEKNSVTSLSTLVNLGSEVYAQAEVPDTRHIFVDVGLGFHVEFTWSEALNYIAAREERLAKQIEEYTHLISRIKADSKMVSGTISELLEMKAE